MKARTIKRCLSRENLVQYSVVRSVFWSCWLALHNQFSMDRWNGRVALVTDASGEIGSSICKELFKHGMSVVGCYETVENMQSVASDEFKGPGKLHKIKCDLTKKDEIRAMFQEIRAKHGRVDVCVNNAEIITKSPLASADEDDWDKILKVNVLALCICTRESLALMKEKNIEDGQIINMGSFASHKLPVTANEPFPIGMYCGTKSMVKTLAEALRHELKAEKRFIRVATISPGTVQNKGMAGVIDEKDAAKFFKDVKYLQPKDIADAVTYILSTRSPVNVDDVILQPLDFSF